MKRFLVFVGDDYYPQGGWRDFRGDYDSQAQAMDAIGQLAALRMRGQWWGWWQVVDTHSDEPRVCAAGPIPTRRG